MSKPLRTLAQTRTGVTAELRRRQHEVSPIATLAEALAVLETAEAAANLQQLMPSRELDEALNQSLELVIAAEETLSANERSDYVAQCFWDRIGERGQQAPLGLAEVLNAGSRAAYSSADACQDQSAWIDAVRQTTRILGPVLSVCAEEVALSASTPDVRLRASDSALHNIIDEYVQVAGIVDAIELFVPVAWNDEVGDPVELPASFANASNIDKCRKLQLVGQDGVHYQAGTYEFGRFGPPHWYVRSHGTIRDAVAQAHEQGHTYIGLVSFEESLSHASLMPSVVGECVAYAAEIALKSDRDDELITREVLRMAAQNAFCSAFGRHLQDQISTGEDGAVVRAWREAALSAGLRTHSADHEWLLISVEGIQGRMYEDHAAGYLAARGGIKSAGGEKIVSAVLDGFQKRRLRTVIEEWMAVGERSIENRSFQAEHDERLGISLPTEREIAVRIPLIDSATAVFLSGSLIAGLGHANSDIDVYVVLPDSAAVAADTLQLDAMTGASVLAFYVDKLRWDVEYVTESHVEKVVERLFGDPMDMGLSHGDQDLMYRCLVGAPMKNPDWLSEIKATIEQSNIYDAVTDKNHSLADGLLDDALGLVEVDDIESAAHCARLAYEHMADAWLARTRRICPSSKWRDRQLAMEPAGPISVEEYRAITQFREYDGTSEWVFKVVDRARELGLDL